MAPLVGEACNDGIDNNGDLLVDCDDPLCHLTCQNTPPPVPTSGIEPPWPACALKTGDRSHTPVDIIWTVDSSFSMSDEMGWIQQNMNEFVERLTGLELDVRVVVLGGKEICVPQPLGGPGCTNGERYRHVNEYVGSHDALKQIIALYPRYKDFIRPKAKKVLIITSDDNSEVDAGWFNQAIAAKPGFSDGFIFHSIVSFGTHPKGCLTGAAPGLVYLALTEQTGGMKISICQTDWTAVFADLATRVTEMIDPPCSYAADPTGLPEDQTLSPERIQVNTSAVGGSWAPLPRRGSAAECAEGGWYLDAATTTVHLCPATCQAEELSRIEVHFGCVDDIG